MAAQEAVCAALGVKVQHWMENSLENEEHGGATADLSDGFVRTTMPDDCLRPICFMMSVLGQPKSVIWTLRAFRCVSEKVTEGLTVSTQAVHTSLHTLSVPTTNRFPEMFLRDRL